MLLERQKEGIAKAKANGVYRGRPPADNRTEVTQLLNAGLAPTRVAKLANIHINTVYRIKKEIGFKAVKDQKTDVEGVVKLGDPGSNAAK